MATKSIGEWTWERTLNERALEAMKRRQAWMEFVLELNKQFALNYRRHFFPDNVIQTSPQPPEISTPTDLNRRLRLKEEARKRLGLPKPPPPLPPEPEPPEPQEPPMTVLGRQMFETSGTLTAATPGDFSSVDGTLHQVPGGARLSDGIAASADPMVWGQGGAVKVLGYLAQTLDQPKIVIGCWFFFKQIGGGTNRAAIMALGTIDPYVEIVVSESTLKFDIIYQDDVTQVLPFHPTNEWVYVSMAARNMGGAIWSIRAFYKRLGEANLTQWVSCDNRSGYLASFPNAMFGMHWNIPSYEGRISACTVHAFENDDFSDVVYPSEIIEPV